jgi:hypothetical protein
MLDYNTNKKNFILITYYFQLIFITNQFNIQYKRIYC